MTWFVAAPNADADFLRTARIPATQELTHSSGHPWLIGDWEATELTHAVAGETRLAVFGHCPVTVTELQRLAAGVTSMTDVDLVTEKLSGCFQLIAVVNGSLRAQGSVSEVRRIFYTSATASPCISNRSDVLASLAESSVDIRWMVSRLLHPGAPHPLADTSPWNGVESLPGDHYVRIDRDKRVSLHRWWNPPASTRSRKAGAEPLREALTNAVTTRVQGLDVVSSDLSGGLDSTTVCSLGDGQVEKLLALTFPSTDPGNDDAEWARQAAATMPGVDHLVPPPEDIPLPFTDFAQANHGLDEPYGGLHGFGRVAHAAELSLAHGSSLHLAGHGGDEVLQAPLPYLHDLAWRRPWLALRHIRGNHGLRKLSWRGTASLLVDRRSYGSWLHEMAAGIDSPFTITSGAGVHGWGMQFRLPPWVTPYAVDTARQLIRDAAATTDPIADDRTQHAALDRIRAGGRLARMLGQVHDRLGVPMASPFLDDRVVEACLAVCPHERTTPLRYKPLLVEALGDRIPALTLERSTKGYMDTDVRRGLRHYRHDVLRLCENSLLAEAGLVDETQLRAACLGPYPPDLPLGFLTRTLACESWLRSQQHAPFMTTSRPGS